MDEIQRNAATAEDQRQARILAKMERRKMNGFQHETPADANEQSAEHVARRPERTRGSKSAVWINPSMFGLGVIEVPTCVHPQELVADALHVKPGCLIGTMKSEEELDQVWVHAHDSVLLDRRERAIGWLSHDAWVPLELPVLLEQMLEYGPALPSIDMLEAFYETAAGRPAETTLAELERVVIHNDVRGSHEQIEAVAIAAARAQRAQQRMNRRHQTQLRQGSDFKVTFRNTQERG